MIGEIRTDEKWSRDTGCVARIVTGRARKTLDQAADAAGSAFYFQIVNGYWNSGRVSTRDATLNMVVSEGLVLCSSYPPVALQQLIMYMSNALRKVLPYCPVEDFLGAVWTSSSHLRRICS